MTSYVVDASVILKWVLGDEKEPDHEKAVDLLRFWTEGGAELMAPSLWKYEVGNFLGRNLQQNARDKMNLLINLNIGNVELSKTMYEQCSSWMDKNKVTFYDACYLAAAFEVQGILITADQNFVSKMGKTKKICLLTNIDLG
jgi:predicted nucleic acid-binding protein